MRILAFIFAALAALAAPALALTPEAKEFLEISKKLEPVHCEKRQLRRKMAMARAEQREDDFKSFENRFAELNRNPATAKQEKRLAELEKRISGAKGSARNAEDLTAISLQQREAFYRCE